MFPQINLLFPVTPGKSIMTIASDLIAFSANPAMYPKLDNESAKLQYRPTMFLLFVHQIVICAKEVICTKDTWRM